MYNAGVGKLQTHYIVRVGFSGTRTGRIVHVYKHPDTGAIRASITADATFSSTLGVDVCNFDNANYRVENTQGSIYNINTVTESHQSNQPSFWGTKWSQYELSYHYNGNNLTDPASAGLWIRCDADASVTSSGNIYHPSMRAKNQVQIGNTTYSFG